MVSRSTVELILEIDQQRERFADSDFWITPEENHRLRALGCKRKADLGDSISMYTLEGKSIIYELMKLLKLKEKQKICQQ